MRADSWTTIHCNYFAGVDSIPTVYRVRTPVFLNGSFHWATKRSKWHRTNETDYIVYYKVKDEKVGIMNVFDNYSAIFDIVVDDDERSFDDWKLSVIDERLAMIHWCGERGNLFEVWVMNDYGIDNSWTRLFQIADTLCSYVNPMGYWTNGLMLLDRTACLKRGFDQLQVFFFYDVETRSLKKIPLDHSTGQHPTLRSRVGWTRHVKYWWTGSGKNHLWRQCKSLTWTKMFWRQNIQRGSGT
ncbi:uncharacterized protein LOC135147628 isoform X2 [Daucus carota subsp. sativus]|uniref:uncharacterized protein LOC135147628 isoform X2 n=1 Tax=Daucus carota subsp. sativus TaxID=79200 RepID=UPI0030830390